MARKRIGELLLSQGLITGRQLEDGLATQKQTRQRLGVTLIEKGFIREDQLAQVLAQATGLPAVDLARIEPDWSAIHTLRPRFCEANDLFPYGLEGNGAKKALVVAMADPLNAPALQEIEFTTGLKVNPRVAPLSAIRAAILRYYHKVDPAAAGATHMTVVHRGGGTLEVKPDAEEDLEVIEGEVVENTAVAAPPERDALTALIDQREKTRRQQRQKPKTALESMSKDLDYLFGVQEEPDPVEQLERKFWALMRIMARKGIISSEEFSQELDDEGQ